MAVSREVWKTIEVYPLIGGLDTRSRPADVPPGGFRWKQNFAVDATAKLCRRSGFTGLYPNLLFDNLGQPLTDPHHAGSGVFRHNPDYHHQGRTREVPTMLFESTQSDGTRRLFVGTEEQVAVLNDATGYWTDIMPGGLGAFRSRWKAAELQDNIIFTNGINDVYSYPLPTGPAATIPDLIGLQVKAALVVVQYNGFIFLMNFTEAGVKKPTRIRWCDLNGPLNWAPGNPANTLASFQDLPYGDDILGAVPLLGSLYIFTRRSIWKMTVAPQSATAPFTFQQVYNEPKNQTGCLLYRNTLVSTGQDIWYASRDGIYRYNPYIPKPIRDDWMHKADGVIFRKPDTALDGTDCEGPVAEYVPSQDELWISWPSSQSPYNNWSLVSQLVQLTSDVVDTGFMAFTNYRPTPVPSLCNETQNFLGVSGRDWCIKAIGAVFLREYLVLPVANDPTVDTDRNAPPTSYTEEGYYSILRGMIPLGLNDREKAVRSVLVDDDVSEQSEPCVYRMRIGNSRKLVDPNDLDDFCAPQWRQLEDKMITCPDAEVISAMTASNLKPAIEVKWEMFEQNNFLYFELKIANQDGTPAIGADVCLNRISFSARGLPIPSV